MGLDLLLCDGLVTFKVNSNYDGERKKNFNIKY